MKKIPILLGALSLLILASCEKQQCLNCKGVGLVDAICDTCKGNKMVRNTASYGQTMRDFMKRPSMVECTTCNGYGQVKKDCSACEHDEK